jgi:two-component flavin-dependent monooxygenase
MAQQAPHGLPPSAVNDLATLAGKHAANADAARQLPGEVVDAIVAAGFARYFVPTAWGGSAGTFTELIRPVAQVGEECASAAWCASLAAGAGRMGAYLPIEGQAELWSAGPDTFIVGALSPSGRAERQGSGWRLRGEWAFATAAGHSQWAFVCSRASGADHNQAWFFAVPRREYRIVDTWSSVGMRGTASNTLVLDDIFVPAHRGFRREAMFAGRGIGSPARCHSAPLRLVSGLLFAGPALGAARGTVRSWLDWIRRKVTVDGRAARERASLQVALARSAAEIDAADLLLQRAADIADYRPYDTLDVTRNARDCALSAELLVTAVERLFNTAGTGGQSEASPLQRAWRDIHCIASHVALQFEPHGREYALAVL